LISTEIVFIPKFEVISPLSSGCPCVAEKWDYLNPNPVFLIWVSLTLWEAFGVFSFSQQSEISYCCAYKSFFIPNTW
jgi:hypothetical protein